MRLLLVQHGFSARQGAIAASLSHRVAAPYWNPLKLIDSRLQHNATRKESAKLMILLVGAVGIEPATRGLKVRHELLYIN